MEGHSKMIIVCGMLLAGIVVASPAQGQKVSAICKDGTTSTATAQGACSGHGGVNASATRCVDGSLSKSSGQGACSGHGGVKAAAAVSKGARVLSPTPRASATARAHASANSAVASSDKPDDKNPKGATARCKDGLYSHSKRAGACSGHGGVARWM